MIYFIQDRGTSSIKIGYTEKDCPESRLKAGETWSPAGMVVLATVVGDREAEAALHKKFAFCHERGEWFRPAPELLRFIIEAASQIEYMRGHHEGYNTLLDQEGKGASSPESAPKWPLNIYLAGKIGKNDWRHDIVDVSCGYSNDVQPECGCAPDLPDWPILERSIFEVHHYTGPYFLSCDHGCFHGDDSHGIGADHPDWPPDHGEPEVDNRPRVVQLCRAAIERSDLIFAWIDAPDCYGTIAEIGYAAALGKMVRLGGPKFYRDMWFLRFLSDQPFYGCQQKPGVVLRGMLDIIRSDQLCSL